MLAAKGQAKKSTKEASKQMKGVAVAQESKEEKKEESREEKSDIDGRITPEQFDALPIDQARSKHGKKSNVDLYKRDWVPIQRQESEVVESRGVKVLQFNVLADGLSGARLDTPTKKSFIRVPKECLRWDYRGARICEEIRRCDPDIITAQEVDKFGDISKNINLGSDASDASDGDEKFKGYHRSKQRSGTVKVGKKSKLNIPADGVCVWWRNERFEQVGNPQEWSDKDTMDPKDASSFGPCALAIRLREKQREKPIEMIVLVTHLKSDKDATGEEVRVKQIAYLLSSLKNPENLPVIFGCDLNATSHTETQKDGTEFEAETYLSVLRHEKFGFKSALVDEFGHEPEYSTWKERSSGIAKHTIDYIFYTRSDWKVSARLSIPEESSVNQDTLLPGWEYPSDHFAIGAILVPVSAPAAAPAAAPATQASQIST